MLCVQASQRMGVPEETGEVDLEGQNAQGLVAQSEDLGGIPRETGCHSCMLGSNPIRSRLVKAHSGDHMENAGACKPGGGTPVRRPLPRSWVRVLEWGCGKWAGWDYTLVVEWKGFVDGFVYAQETEEPTRVSRCLLRGW